MSQKPINAAIIGWLGSLGLKQAGANPVELADQVQPILDLESYYQIANEEVLAGNLQVSSAPIPSRYILAQVPPGEVWQLRAGGAYSISSTASALHLTLGFDFGPQSQNTAIVPLGSPFTLNAATVPTRIMWPLYGFAYPKGGMFIRSGYRVCLWVAQEEPTAQPLDTYWQIGFRRFPI